MKYRYREPHELKESGIEWIGKIPKEWEVSIVKNFYDVTLGKMLQPEKNDKEDTLEKYLCSINVDWAGANLETLKEMWFSTKEKKKYSLKRGDLVVNEGGDAGKACVWNAEIENCYIQNAVHRIRGKNNNIVNYLYYWLFTLKTGGYIDLICNKATITHFTAEKFNKLILILPNPAQQSLIASFLDKKCAEFDGIIEKKESIISKLEEAKKSLISEVVTGKVKIENGKIIPRKEEEMKDSGIEWIGKIPKEWEVTRVKRFLESQKQGFYTTEDYADSGVKLVRITDINDSSEISYEKCPHVEINEKDKRIFDLKKGDFLFARSGTIGRFGVVENEENAVFASYLIRFRFSNIKERYLKHYFSSELFKACLFSSLHGGANQNIHAENIKEPFLMVPSDFEQSLIASFLDKKTEEIDSVITKIRDQIEKIKKAKQSLISEAVTGKIEVMEE